MRHRSQARVASIVVLLAVVMVGAAALTPATLSRASWHTTEWVHGPLASTDCEGPGVYASQAQGRLLRGSLLGVDLDNMVLAPGVKANHDGTSSTVTPASATALGNDAYAHALSVGVLGTISAELLGILTFPGDVEAGILNQYAQATGTGYSAGASGMVNDSGVIDFGSATHHSQLPTLATVHVGSLLTAVTGQMLSSTMANVTDARLKVGAVGASSALDACGAQWEDVYSSLVRDYLVAGLLAEFDSPVVSDVISTVDNGLTALEASIESIASSHGLVDSLTSGVLEALGDILQGLGLEAPSATVELTVDFTATRQLLHGTITDSQNIVAIDLGTGTMTVDIAALVDNTHGLNAMPPNSQLLLDDAVINTLTSRIADALSSWANELTARLTGALDSVGVNVLIAYPVTLLTALSLEVKVQGSVRDLMQGNGTIELRRTGTCNLVTAVVCATVDAVLGAATLVTKSNIANAVVAAVAPLISATTAPLVSTISTAVTGLSGSVVTLLSGSLGFLFGEQAVLSVVVNAQNAPDPAEDIGAPEPTWAAGLPEESSNPYSTGQYDVAALRIVGMGILGGTGVLELDIGRASAGSNSSL